MPIDSLEGWNVDEQDQEQLQVAAPSPVPESDWQTYDPKEHATRVAEKYGFDPEIFHNLINAESAWKENALGPVTKYGQAKGLTQLIPATAKSMGVTDPYDPMQSIEGGGKFFKQMLDKFGGDYTKALAAYNWGPANIENWGGDHSKLPVETQVYLKKILGPEGKTDKIASVTSAEPKIDKDLSKWNVAPELPTSLGDYMQRAGDVVDWLQSPTPWPEVSADDKWRSAQRIADTLSTGIAKATWKLNPLVWGYHGAKAFTDPIVRAVEESVLPLEEQIARHDIDSASYSATPDPVGQNLSGLLGFAGRPIGAYGWDEMKKAWKTEPVDSALGVLSLLAPGIAARYRKARTGEYTQGEQIQFAKDSADLFAQEHPGEEITVPKVGETQVKPELPGPYQPIPGYEAPEFRAPSEEAPIELRNKVGATPMPGSGDLVPQDNLRAEQIETLRNEWQKALEERGPADLVTANRKAQYDAVLGESDLTASPAEILRQAREPIGLETAEILRTRNERRNQAADIFLKNIYESEERARAAAEVAARKFNLEMTPVQEGDFWHLERGTGKGTSLENIKLEVKTKEGKTFERSAHEIIRETEGHLDLFYKILNCLGA